MELTFEQLPKAVGEIFESLQRIENLLKENKEIKPDSEIFLSVKEAAKFLDISVSRIYKYTMDMEIPLHKKGKRIYFLKSDLIEWIKMGRRKTIEEIKVEANAYQFNRNKNQKLSK